MLLQELFAPAVKILLKEGGNLELPGGHRAQHIDLRVHDRSYIVPILKKLMTAINTAYQKQYKVPLWSPELLQSGKFLSGSSLHFFDTNIPDEEFAKVKPKVGDIDTQVDRDKAADLDTFLQGIKGRKIGPAVFLGYERGNEQFSSLWELSEPPLKIQIDLEFVHYEGGEPTDWSAFSHSSAWEDIQSGIKGVFHKYIIQSFASLTKTDFLLRKMVGRGKSRVEQDVSTTDNMVSFAVSSKEGGGLRQKFEPVLDDAGKPLIKDGLQVLKARPTEGYDQSLSSIFANLFGKKLTPENFKRMSKKFWSFTGLLDVMNELLDDSEKNIVVENFIKKLFGPGAQGLYKNDPERDIAEKSVALKKMIDVLGVSAPADLDQQIDTYKASYKMTESLSEADTPDYKRQGIKHIYNPGSSTEMKDLDFITMCDEIAKNGGTLDGIQVNLKVDGAGIRFGKDASGRPFMMTSKVTKPMYASDIGMFRRYGEEHGQTGEQLKRTEAYDHALAAIANSNFIKSLPSDCIVQAELLFNEMAQKSDDGYKFVNIDYDPKKLGTKMTLVPFSFRQYSTGDALPNAQAVKKKLMSYSSPEVKFVDNHLTQRGVDVSKIVDPIVKNQSNLKAALSSKKKDDPNKAAAKEILNKARKALSDVIINSPNIKGKDQLGSNIEGLVINLPNGQLAKVTSSEMKAKMAAKKATTSTAHNRTRTAVVTAGSFVGHKGHEQLVNLVLKKAAELGGDPYVYISSKVGPDDPIPPMTKLETWQKLYPSHANIFHLIVSPDGITSPSPVKKIEKELVLPADSPYKKVILMVGDDRYEGFKKWMDTLEKRMKDPVALAKFGGTQDQVDFETVRTGRSTEEGGTGMSFTQLRNILKDPNATEEQKLNLWCKGFDEKKLGRVWIKHLMDIAEKNMGLKTVEEAEVWDKPNPKKKHKTMTPAQKAEAKRRAKAAGRPYPNLVDNMAVMKK